MSITFRDIYKYLEKEIAHYQLTESCMDNNVRDVKLLVKNQTKYNKDTVYVGTTSFLANSDFQNKDACIIVINDLETPLESSLLHLNTYIELNSGCDLFEKFNEINDIFNNEQKIHRIMECQELSEIAKKSSDLFENPIIIIDSNFRVLAHSSIESIRDSGWRENIEKGFCSYEYIAIVNAMKEIKESLHNTTPFLVNCEISPIKRCVSKFFLHGRLGGYIVVLLENKELDEIDRENIVKISKITSSCYSNKLGKKNINNLDYDNFLLDLLNNKVTNIKILNEKMKIYKGKFKKNMVVIVMDIRGFDSRINSEGYFSKQIDKLFNRRSIYFENQVVVLYDYEIGELENLKFNKKLYDFARDNNVVIGVSNVFLDLILVHQHYLEAKKALEIREKIHYSNPLIEFKEVGFYALYSEAENRGINVSSYIHPALEILKNYDQKNHTELYLTLFEYLKTNQNAVLTGKELFIHRNTVKYRMDKIVELTKIDLNHYSEVLNIMFSYRAMLMREK